MFGANVSMKLEQYKDCIEHCKAALNINSDFKTAKEMMQMALQSEISREKAKASKKETSKFDSILLIKDFPLKKKQEIYDLMKEY